MHETPEKRSPAPVADGPASRTSVVTVFGWLCIVFALIPLAMGVQGANAIALKVGAAMTVLGLALIALGRAGRRRPA